MTDVFEQLAPQWKNAVKVYALSVWTGKNLDDARLLYDAKAAKFAKRYRRTLEAYYAEKGMRVYRGTLDGKVKEWLSKQTALRDTLPQAIQDRQQGLVEKEIERLRVSESPDAQKMLNKLYDARKGENVYKVFSFAEGYEAKAEQIGEENAFNLGTDINETIIKQLSDIYIWRTQRDRAVRYTHRKLADKCFLFDDPPTEVSKSGKVHTGNPGSAWGCRCFAEIPTKKIKPLRKFVVHEH